MCAHQLQDFVLLPHTGWRLVQAYSTTWRKKKEEEEEKKGYSTHLNFITRHFPKTTQSLILEIKGVKWNRNSSMLVENRYKKKYR